jgi:sugar fermentation stimulation protein
VILRILAFAYRDWLFAKRNIFAIVEMLFWPIVGMLSIGLMGDFLQLDRSMRAFILTGSIALGTLQVTQLDVAYALLHDIWSKSVKHTFLTPTGVVEYLLGPWLVGIFRGTIVFFLLAGFSRWFFDFYLPGSPDIYLEVKSVSMGEGKKGAFPDSVTERGQKHIRELMALKEKGHRVILFFLLMREGGETVTTAKEIDPEYDRLLRDAVKKGLEVLVYAIKVDESGIILDTMRKKFE